MLITVGCITLRRGSANAKQCTDKSDGNWYLIVLRIPKSSFGFTGALANHLAHVVAPHGGGLPTTASGRGIVIIPQPHPGG
jgi:hypothetical protein